MKITNIRNETGDIATGSADIRRVINKGMQYKQLTTYKFHPLDKMGYFLEKHRLPQLTQYEIDI